ncbi:MAG: hypothetical protein QM537_01520 [Candidatus Symbiobacter sp.]|nr:hypothetical protein [Candidatus Symbiobacter sp.]
MTQITHKDENEGFGFDFSQAQNFVEFDKIFRNKFQGLMVVDFCFEQGHNLFMVEVKDPSHPKIPNNKIDKETYSNPKNLIKDQLVPKIRDSYLIQHLNDNLRKNVYYIFLFGNDRINLQPEEIDFLEKQLIQTIRKETDHTWKLEYVQECYVVTEQTWGLLMKDYPLTRLAKT